MLYDPKWNGPSLASFIAWLETKDQAAQHNFENCEGGCLIGLYMTAMGIEWGTTPKAVEPSRLIRWDSTNYWKVATKLFGRGPWEVIVNKPHTFGAALKRARHFAKVAR